MSLPSNYCRVAIAGASSLAGKDLSAALEERGFPCTDVRLLDDEVIEGTLAETAGDPVVIQGVDEETFDGVRFAFFAGAAQLTLRHWEQAARAGSTVIDLTGALAKEPGVVSWIPSLRKLLPPPVAVGGKLFSSPSTPVIVSCALSTALREFDAKRISLTVFQPVSEQGPDGIEELETQTVNLLSLKPFPAGVFDAQVAFNLLTGYGEESKARLADTCAQVGRDVKAYLAGRATMPALQFVQAPVFYGHAFSGFFECGRGCESGEIERTCEAAGMKVATAAAHAPSNVSVAGESVIHLGPVVQDNQVPNGFWIWGVADNLRLASANAISIAETLLAS